MPCVGDSLVLRAGMRDMFGRYETTLAALLAEQTDAGPGAPGPFVAAVALVGVVRAAFEAPGDAVTRPDRRLQLPARG